MNEEITCNDCENTAFFIKTCHHNSVIAKAICTYCGKEIHIRRNRGIRKNAKRIQKTN